MFYALLGFVILALIADRYLRERAHEIDKQKTIQFCENTVNRMATQVEESRAQVSEMATRIAHPEIIRPDIDPDHVTQEMPPVFDDDIGLVGKIVSAEENGDG